MLGRRWRRVLLLSLAVVVIGFLSFLLLSSPVLNPEEDPLYLREAARLLPWASDRKHHPLSPQPSPPQQQQHSQHLHHHQQQQRQQPSPPPPAPRQPTSLEDFQTRSKRLRDACGARNTSASQQDPPYPYHLLWVKSMTFCALPKTGTTFWKWILYYVDKDLKGPLLSHDYGDIHRHTRYMQKASRLSQKDGFSNIVFVREPYARLFSAYVDKLFTPRWENWQRLARPAMTFSRPHGSRLDLRCAHNVTFAEFVHYFVHTELHRDSGERRDEHFVPISQQCNMCGIPYHFIGRQESFAADTLGILQQLNLSSILTFEELDREYEGYFMENLIRYTFQHEIFLLSAVERCMNSEEILRRVWKALQIRGILSAQEFFPLARSDVRGITVDSFLLMAQLAHNRSANDKGRQHNTEQAFLEAFSTVPLSDRRLLRQIFDEDFKFFGYNPEPLSVFPPEDEFDLPYYRYFDVFDSFLYSVIV